MNLTSVWEELRGRDGVVFEERPVTAQNDLFVILGDRQVYRRAIESGTATALGNRGTFHLRRPGEPKAQPTAAHHPDGQPASQPQPQDWTPPEEFAHFPAGDGNETPPDPLSDDELPPEFSTTSHGGVQETQETEEDSRTTEEDSGWTEETKEDSRGNGAGIDGEKHQTATTDGKATQILIQKAGDQHANTDSKEEDFRLCKTEYRFAAERFTTEVSERLIAEIVAMGTRWYEEKFPDDFQDGRVKDCEDARNWEYYSRCLILAGKRVLVTYAQDQDIPDYVVTHFGERLQEITHDGVDAEEFVVGFDGQKLKSPVGRLEFAAKMARPIILSHDRLTKLPELTRLAAVLLSLADLHNGQPFSVSTAAFGRLFGVHHNKIGPKLQMLVKYKVIDWAGPSESRDKYGPGKSRQAIWIGTQGKDFGYCD